MNVKIGDLEFSVTLVNKVDQDPLDLTLRELLRGAAISIYSPLLSQSVVLKTATTKQDEDDEPQFETEAPVKEYNQSIPKKDHGPVNYFKVLKETLGLSGHTMTMVTKRMFGLKIPSDQIERQFEFIKESSLDWPKRSLAKESVWGIFLAPIQPTKLGRRFLALGLDQEGHQLILGMERSEKDLYVNLKARGLPMSKIPFGMLSFEMNAKLFRQYFPETHLGRDWQEFIEMSEDSKEQERIKALMINPNKKDVAKQLKELNGPEELLTYFKFDKEFWRVLRTAGGISKIDTEIRSNTKDLSNPLEIDFATIWSLLRIQYQWLRIPVNAKQFHYFSNVKPVLAPAAK